MYVFIIVVGLFVAIAISAIVIGEVQKRKRARELREAADELGLAFHPDGNSTLESSMSRLEHLRQGRGHVYRNITIADTADVKISIFDFQYTTGHGKSKRHHRQTVVGIESAKLRMPTFRARPEGFFDAIGGALGFQDIDFDEHPEFSKAFVLKSNSEEQTRNFFDPPLLDFFATRKGLYFEAQNQRFAYYKHRKRVEPTELRSSLEEGYRVFGALRDRLERGHEL